MYPPRVKSTIYVIDIVMLLSKHNMKAAIRHWENRNYSQMNAKKKTTKKQPRSEIFVFVIKSITQLIVTYRCTFTDI